MAGKGPGDLKARGLEHLSSRSPQSLREAQRCSSMPAGIDSKLWLLDEPANHLDPLGKNKCIQNCVGNGKKVEPLWPLRIIFLVWSHLATAAQTSSGYRLKRWTLFRHCLIWPNSRKKSASSTVYPRRKWRLRWRASHFWTAIMSKIWITCLDASASSYSHLDRFNCTLTLPTSFLATSRSTCSERCSCWCNSRTCRCCLPSFIETLSHTQHNRNNCWGGTRRTRCARRPPGEGWLREMGVPVFAFVGALVVSIAISLLPSAITQRTCFLGNRSVSSCRCRNTGLQFQADIAATYRAVQWSLGSMAQVDLTHYNSTSFMRAFLHCNSDANASTWDTYLWRGACLYPRRKYPRVRNSAYSEGLGFLNCRLVWTNCFLGLVVPHIVRMAFGNARRMLFPLSAVVGAAFLVLCDALARIVLPGREIPVGVLALFGAPMLIFLVVNRRKASVANSGGSFLRHSKLNQPLKSILNRLLAMIFSLSTRNQRNAVSVLSIYLKSRILR